MDFRILGPLEVLDGGRPVALGGSKQRALLALLLLNAGEVVSRDRLIDGLWGNAPPETAGTALQVHVSQLRKIVGREIIVTRSPGYLIRVGEGELDLVHFERLVDAARGEEPAEASERLREALALWRGPPLADLDDLEFAHRESARLEERRLAAVEQRVDAELELGEHAALVPELDALVREHPLRERLRGQLMLALYRSGRAAEALDVYQNGRRLLAEELGLEPGEALKRLERAILEQDPELGADAPALPARPARAVPTGTVTFMFSDVEDPTGLVDSLKDSYAELLEEHSRLVRAAVHEHGGLEIVNEEDAFFIAFRRAREAVEAAIAAQRAVQAAAWPRDANVRIRIGIHTGEPHVTDGAYHGLDVVRAARVAGAASGGQILVSSATRDLVEGTLADITFHAIGEHLLPEVNRPQRLFQVRAPGLETQFPPPPSEGGARVMAIAGREEELAAAAQAAVGAETRRLRLFRRSRLAVVAGAVVLVGVAAAIAVALTGGGSAAVKVVPNSVALVDPESLRVAADVPVGQRPVAVAAGEGGIWTANADDQTVSRIDPKTRKVVSTIGIGADVSDIAAGFGAVWVADGNDGTITEIDPRLNAVRGTIPLGPQDELAPNPVFSIATGLGSVWATRGNHLVRIDPKTAEPTATFPIPAPVSIALGEGAVWVATQDERLLRLDPRNGKPIGSLPLPAGPLATVVGSGSVWVSVWLGRGQIWSVDPATVIQNGTWTAETPPVDLAVGRGSVWAAELGGTVRRIDTRTDTSTTTPIGLAPQALAVDSRGVWVAVQRPS
jgi:DNA-binding SARP family transcriptional activator/DNA-binding beta-propeller fold protein YncE